jgi:hypothetical protein
MTTPLLLSSSRLNEFTYLHGAEPSAHHPTLHLCWSFSLRLSVGWCATGSQVRHEHAYDRWRALGQSKLAALLHARELGRRCQAQGLQVGK